MDGAVRAAVAEKEESVTTEATPGAGFPAEFLNNTLTTIEFQLIWKIWFLLQRQKLR
jgi:hypothetical protein